MSAATSEFEQVLARSVCVSICTFLVKHVSSDEITPRNVIFRARIRTGAQNAASASAFVLLYQ
jgi:hypothetical protein